VSSLLIKGRQKALAVPLVVEVISQIARQPNDHMHKQLQIQ
jgi:hypothetical protein